ncbi:MAG: transporter [Caldimicrobium sp.]
MWRGFIWGLMFMVLFTANLFAAHPLITDDSGTQGKGKFQLEITSEFTYDKEKVYSDEKESKVIIKEHGKEIATVLTYGVTEYVDVILNMPYQWKKVKEEGKVVSDVRGISDISLELKWRVFDWKGWNFAIKPGLLFPTGNEKKGLGNGRVSYSSIFIVTKEINPWAFHFNLGYTHNNYKLKQDREEKRKGIWHISAAGEVEVIKNLKLVGDIGVERNPEKKSKTHPAYILGGLIYSISENLDLDLGIKGGLNKPEVDFSFLAGLTWRF